MRPVSLPPIRYGATAVRPGWTDLPPAVRREIDDRLGSPVVTATSAGGGFTRAFAAVVTSADGSRAFVKAAAADTPEAFSYAREAAITGVLPAEVPAPRLRWTATTAGHIMICTEAIDGHVPEMPWSPVELDAAVRAWRRAAAALARPPDGLPYLPRLSDLIRQDLSCWTRGPVPGVPDWADRRWRELQHLERALLDMVDAPGMLHGDLRVDNVLIDGGGGAWLCDWSWPCLGPAWFDTVTLLVTAYASGFEVDDYLDDAPAGGVDGALAALSGYWLVGAAAGPTSAARDSLAHQRFSGHTALSWLAARRGWR
jgi:aminoglycoside phosphotransferase (APT) family kinase protein